MKTLAHHGRFLKAALLPAEDFYRANVEQFRQRGHRATARCPFHHPDRHPSLRIDLTRGLYYCDVCQAGGDVLDFVMRRDHVDFVTAAKKLNAWDGGLQIDAVVIRQIRIEQERQEKRRQAERELEERYFRAEDWLYCIEGIYAESNMRLSELHKGAVEIFPDEQEIHWHILALAQDEIRDAESAFIRARCTWPGAPRNERARNWRETRWAT
jgi:hypothetical protein